MKRSLTVLIAALTAAASAQQPAPPAGQPQTFKSGVQTVEVDVRVFDKSGQFVTNLKADDFEVIEDGVPQKVQTAFFVGGPGGQGPGSHGIQLMRGILPPSRPPDSLAPPPRVRRGSSSST